MRLFCLFPPLPVFLRNISKLSKLIFHFGRSKGVQYDVDIHPDSSGNGISLCPRFVKADPLVLINFDDPPPAPLETYRSQGVELSTIFVDPSLNVDGGINGIALLTSPAAVSPPQGAFPIATNPLFNGINGLSVSFVFTTEGVVVPGVTHFISFNVIGSQGTWTLLFFDDTNQSFVDLTTGLVANLIGDTDRLIIFDSPDPIGRFVFIPSQLNGTEGIDNLQFEATSVPEPASMLLLSLSIGGLLALKRGKRVS